MRESTRRGGPGGRRPGRADPSRGDGGGAPDLVEDVTEGLVDHAVRNLSRPGTRGPRVRVEGHRREQRVCWPDGRTRAELIETRWQIGPAPEDGASRGCAAAVRDLAGWILSWLVSLAAGIGAYGLTRQTGWPLVWALAAAVGAWLLLAGLGDHAG